MRKRFAVWLCQPLLDEQLKELRRTIAENDARTLDLEVSNHGLKLLCEGLAADLNATLGELRQGQVEQSSQPRVRTARRFSEFSEAATLAANKRSK